MSKAGDKKKAKKALLKRDRKEAKARAKKARKNKK